jgi:hypothetical protein
MFGKEKTIWGILTSSNQGALLRPHSLLLRPHIFLLRPHSFVLSFSA